MTNETAIQRLKSRVTYLKDRIEQFRSEAKSIHWLEQDVLANEIAIAAVEYIINTEMYDDAKFPALS